MFVEKLYEYPVFVNAIKTKLSCNDNHGKQHLFTVAFTINPRSTFLGGNDILFTNSQFELRKRKRE